MMESKRGGLRTVRAVLLANPSATRTTKKAKSNENSRGRVAKD